MKNKGLTYGLIIVVAAIWYQVFVRVKSNIVGEDAPAGALLQHVTEKRLAKREAFRLRADYRDPFSGSFTDATERPSAAVNDVTPAFREPSPPKPKPLPPQWPAIRYYGLVRATKSAVPRTLLSIDGVFYQIRQGEVVLDNITVRKTYPDSVVINYRKQNRTFYKTK